jgi:UDP-N-acetylmuramoyl-tripeptide--D-alanyl-D-alanine ligase
MKKLLAWPILWYLRFFAKLAITMHKPTVIGIAGSLGKSSASNALYAILKNTAKTHLVGNSETGIPLGILGLTPTDYSPKDWLRMLIRAPLGVLHLQNTRYLIAEMGIDDPFPPKNMSYLLTIVKPHIAVLLNESATHTMQFEKLLSEKQKKEMSATEKVYYLVQKIAEEDTRMIAHDKCRVVVYNADDKLLAQEVMKQKLRSTAAVPYGKEEQNFVSYTLFHTDLKGTSCRLRTEGSSEEIDLYFPGIILPTEYREIFAASVAVALQLGISKEIITNNLTKNFTLPKGRSSILAGIHDTIIIDSSYNASRNAVFAFLDLVRTLKRTTKRPVGFLFGDMRELGSEAKHEHEAVAAQMVGIVDYLYCVGPMTREFVLPVVQLVEDKFKEIRWFANASYAGEYLKENLPKDTIILVKGSQNTIYLEETIKYILKDKKDTAKLCRQSEAWIMKKRAYFKK